MTKQYRPLWIVAALSVVALVPLYGDPRRSPVTHAEWARLMMRGVGLEDHLEALDSADDIFDALAWKDQRNLKGSEFKRGTGVTRRGDFVDAGDQPGEVAYDLPVIRTGDYNIRLRLRGAPDTPFKVEIRRDGQPDAVQTFQPTGDGDEYTPVDLGWTKLDPGNHTISVMLPPGSSLESIQVSPPCLSPIEPRDGWRAAAVTTDEDLAITMLQALEREEALPPADDAIEVRAGSFRVLGPESRVGEQGDQTDDFRLDAKFEGLHAIVYADIPVAGRYTVSAWTTTGDGQTWVADSCRRTDICPSPASTTKWRTLLSSEFNVGRHSFEVLLTNGAQVGKIRLQRLKTAPEDYVGALEREGFRVGSKGPISREKAREAMEWLRDKWKERLAADPACTISAPVGKLSGGTPGQSAGGSLSTPTTGGGGAPGGTTPPSVPPTGPPQGPPIPPPTSGDTQPPATPVLPVR